ncbi:MAG: hydroxyethylthiazole kinase [Gammaproteobacteria bacterium]|nr:hydroxyethylthiazole kinase [Gammaproteobacteria bacterium]
MQHKIKLACHKIQSATPLILNLTNYVSADFVANGLIALGASPIMSYAPEESELVTIAKALVINFGTLHNNFIRQCEKFCEVANNNNIPIILDPVGAGASELRTATVLNFLQTFSIAIIRGNASEIDALSSGTKNSKGVDTTLETKNIISNAIALSTLRNCTIVVSGKTDIIIDKEKIAHSDYGSNLMTKVTGTGCLLSAFIGAFHAIDSDRFNAARLATTFYGWCAHQAEMMAPPGPASFKINFLDKIYQGIQ